MYSTEAVYGIYGIPTNDSIDLQLISQNLTQL